MTTPEPLTPPEMKKHQKEGLALFGLEGIGRPIPGYACDADTESTSDLGEMRTGLRVATGALRTRVY